MYHQRLLFSMLLIFCTYSAWAASWGSCTYETKEYSFTVSSGVQLSIDPNLAIGTVLYSTRYMSPVSGSFNCSDPQTYTEKKGFIIGSGGGATETMSGYGLTNGAYPVYKTNVAGIGVVFRDGSSALPHLQGTTNRVAYKPGGASLGMSFSIDLIKYGEITLSSGTVNINSSGLPKIEYVINISNSTNTGQFPDGNIPIVGITLAPVTFNILNATCDTPDVAVDLGKRKISDAANQSGGKFVTPWVDASIRLTGCPQFHGIGGRSYEGTTRDNIMSVTLIPNNATTSNQGIMPVDNVAGAAAGVGIQMAWGTSASSQLVNFSAGGKETKKYTMSSAQGANYTIPLVARYMQTASLNDVTAGKANGKVTYLIDYY